MPNITTRKRIDCVKKDIANLNADISFLRDKIRLAERMFSTVIVTKMTTKRDKLIKQRDRLLAKRGCLFNK